jgi:hypothetical protein
MRLAQPFERGLELVRRLHDRKQGRNGPEKRLALHVNAALEGKNIW